MNGNDVNVRVSVANAVSVKCHINKLYHTWYKVVRNLSDPLVPSRSKVIL